MAYKGKVYFAEILEADITKTIDLIISTINSVVNKERFIEIKGSIYFAKIENDIIKFFKLRNDHPVALNENGDIHLIPLVSENIVETTYFLLFDKYMAILKKGYGPYFKVFKQYIDELYKKVNKTNKVDELLNKEIVDMYDKNVIDNIKKYSMSKFQIKISAAKLSSYNVQLDNNKKDNVLDSLHKVVLTGVNSQTETLFVSMSNKQGFLNSTKNYILDLVDYIDGGKVTINNGKQLTYDLLKQRIKYEYSLTNNEDIHTKNSLILSDAKKWFIKEYYNK